MYRDAGQQGEQLFTQLYNMLNMLRRQAIEEVTKLAMDERFGQLPKQMKRHYQILVSASSLLLCVIIGKMPRLLHLRPAVDDSASRPGLQLLLQKSAAM